MWQSNARMIEVQDGGLAKIFTLLRVLFSLDFVVVALPDLCSLFHNVLSTG